MKKQFRIFRETIFAVNPSLKVNFRLPGPSPALAGKRVKLKIILRYPLGLGVS